MNKLITICLLLLAAWTQGNAQNTLGSIRERYAAVKSDIAEMTKEDGWPREYHHLQVMQNLPATGPHLEDVKMYWGERDDDEGDGPPRSDDIRQRWRRLFAAVGAETPIPAQRPSA